MIGNWNIVWTGALRNLVKGRTVPHLDASDVHIVVQLGKNSWHYELKADMCYTSCPVHLMLQFLKTFNMLKNNNSKKVP